MCGIAGFCTHSELADGETILRDMIQEIHHRGPDADGCCLYDSPGNGRIGLGHKRLSIIDLSANGNQPMESVSRKLSIIFNGEIYNYQVLRQQLEQEGCQFRTNTDTEVILNMYEKYGEKCLQHFNGMFAFAIYDRSRDQIFLARDRLGIRPLYYYYDSRTLVFASEIKALLKHPAVPRQVSHSALYQYVQFRYVQNPETIFAGIRKLEPGHFMVIRDSQVTITKYWDIENFDKLPGADLQESMQMLDQAMEDSVKLRMISDVPLGAYLSGGIDSSLIVALMSQNSSYPVKTFSVGFNESQYSELPYARQIARLFKTDHHELVISHKDVIDNIYPAVWFRDAPVSESSDIPILALSREAKKTVSVILTGEGSDELFAGYPKYAYDGLATTRVFDVLLRNRLAGALVNALPYQFRKAQLAWNTMRSQDDLERFDNWFAAVRSDQMEKLFAACFRESYPLVKTDRELKGKTHLDKMMYHDVKYWLTDDLLERGDKMLMAASIEGRVPFLDFNVVELAFRIQDKFRIKGLERKYIVKRMAEKYIPKNIIYRKKVGFYIPIGDWFRNELKDMVGDHLLSERFRQRGIFDPQEIEKMVTMHVNGVRNFEKEIWMLLNLEVWFRTFIDAFEA